MTETKRRTTKPAAERRREIVDAAISLFSERGYHETTVQDVAATAGVATGSVYIHFESKDALLHAINVRFYEGLTERLSEIVDQFFARIGDGETITHVDAVDMIVDAVAAHVKENATLCVITARYVAHSDLIRAEMPFVDFLTRVAEQAAEAGIIHAPQAAMLAHLAHSAISGTMMTSIAYNRPADFEGLVEATKYMFHRTLAPEPTP